MVKPTASLSDHSSAVPEPPKTRCSCVGACGGSLYSWRCRIENDEPLCEPVPDGARVYAAEVFDGYPDLYVWVCPYCRRQYAGPDGHHTAGDDLATSCLHARPGERGVLPPRLVRIKVEAAEPFIPREIPADRTPHGKERE